MVTHESRKIITWVEVPFQTRGLFPDNYRARKAVVVNICCLGPTRLFLRLVWFEYLISGAKSYREFRETGLSPLTLEKTEHKLCAKPVGSFSLKQLRLTCVIFWVWRRYFFGRSKHKLEISYIYIAEEKKIVLVKFLSLSSTWPRSAWVIQDKILRYCIAQLTWYCAYRSLQLFIS